MSQDDDCKNRRPDPRCYQLITNQATNEDNAITGLAYTVDEGGGGAEDSQTLTVSATSSNPALIPNANINTGYADNGAGSANALSPTLTITPVADLDTIVTLGKPRQLARITAKPTAWRLKLVMGGSVLLD